MSAAHQTADRIGLGIGLILASVFAMAFADAVIKLVSADVTLWQCVLRALGGCHADLAGDDVGGWVPLCCTCAGVGCIAQRALGSGLGLVLFGAAGAEPVSRCRRHLHQSDYHRAVVGRPDWRARDHAPVGRCVSWVPWVSWPFCAPGGDDFSWFVLLPILGAVFYSLAMILTRWKCRSEAPISLSLALHLAFVVSGTGWSSCPLGTEPRRINPIGVSVPFGWMGTDGTTGVGRDGDVGYTRSGIFRRRRACLSDRTALGDCDV